MTRVLPAICALALVLALSARAAPARATSALNRPEDPVVITGADVPALQGVAPGEIVGFRYTGGWQQIPVQVDERFAQTFSAIYNNVAPPASSTNITGLVYADPNTFTGADPNPAFDVDDELAFMAKDAGGAAGSLTGPAHTIAGSGVQLTINDPLDPGAGGIVYPFRQDGTLDPGAGQSYVTYNFNLLSGAYKTTYNIFDGPNPENSTITTPYYTHRFGDRWDDDILKITAGAATGADILDRHKALFAPGNCVRSEDTFDNGDSSGYRGEGAFIANKSGPVRAIRSFVGANSGPNTERDQIFYAQRQDIITDLRVHAIPSIMDFFDYSAAASGMVYRNDLNTGGVTIDGVPDSPAPGPIRWEMVTGAQGSLVMSGINSTNIAGFNYTSYYLDSASPSTAQCTGDSSAYGSSGVYVNQAIPCTDPGLGCTSTLTTRRTMYYEAPGETVAGAQALDAGARAPLTVSAQPFAPASVGGIAEAPSVVGLAGGGGMRAWWPAALAAIVVATLIAAVAARRAGRR
ncbi:MAG: hypothetical protein IVW36_06940 [Dehalococcoidia bacterium]|nr:hypothetical protein [Dehalococcoidia bacterium]